MENRHAYVVIFYFCLQYFFFWNEIFTQNVMINIYFNHPPTHLKHQTDVLRDKMGMEVAPKSALLL